MKLYFIKVLILSLLATSACKKDKKVENKPTATESLDSRYSVSGTMKDYSTSTNFTAYYPQEITFQKNSNTQGVMIPKLLGIPGHLIYSGTSTSYYGSIGLVVNFDLATNRISSVTNHYGQPANGRSATLDPSGENSWNPTTKEIKIKYWLDEPTVYSPHRVEFNETWTYLGPK